MSPHELDILHIVHVAALLVLFGYTFYAFSAPPETRKRVLTFTGIAALVLLATGLRMWQGLYGFAFAGWIVVKLVCFLGLSAIAGLAYRRRAIAGLLILLAFVLAFTALAMVYLKPF